MNNSKMIYKSKIQKLFDEITQSHERISEFRESE